MQINTLEQEEEKRLGIVLLKEIAKPDYFIQLKSEFRFMNKNIGNFIEMMEKRREKFCEKNNLDFTPLLGNDDDLSTVKF